MTWEGLSPPYATIVADPPWPYNANRERRRFGPTSDGGPVAVRPMSYSGMSLSDLAALPVADLAADDARLYLWTTSHHLHDAFVLLRAWGFQYSQILTWCKPPMGLGMGAMFVPTTEFVLSARCGSPTVKERVDSSWWEWGRVYGGGGGITHSAKPPAFLDLVERVSPGPYVELFARAPRLGWDHWGYGYELSTAQAGDRCPDNTGHKSCTLEAGHTGQHVYPLPKEDHRG